FRIETPSHLRPPEVQPADVTHDRAADHDVVEVRDDEVGVMEMNVEAEASKEKAGKTADGEEADEAERVEHRRFPRNRTFIESGRPVEDFDGGRYCNEIAQERKCDGRIGRFAGDEHVMRPNDEAYDCNADAGRSDETVAKNRFADECGNDFRNYTHRWKNHDVHGRMRIEPEQVLEQNRVAAVSRIKEAEMEHALETCEQQRDGDDRSAENHNQAGGVMRPNEKRQTKPGHARCAHGVHSDQKIETGQNRGEAVDEDADHRGRDCGIRIDAAEWWVERPPGVEAAGAERIQHEAAADEVNVPAQKVDFGEGDVLRADHDRNQEVSEHGGNRRNQEEENHRHAMHGKELVVGFRRNEQPARREQVNANQRGEDAANEKEKRNRSKIEQCDALVVGSKQPRSNAVRRIQIMFSRKLVFARGLIGCPVHNYFFPVAGSPAAGFPGTGWSFCALMYAVSARI